MKRKLFLFVMGLCLPFVGHGSDLQTLWGKALESEKPQDQIAAFQSFLKEASKEQRLTPSVHSNLATLYWQEKEVAKAQWHLLQATRLRDNPFRSWFDIRKSQQIELDMGISDGLSSSIGFILPRIVSENLRTLLLSLGIWLFVVSVVLLSLKRVGKNKKNMARYGVVLGLMLLAGPCAVWMMDLTQQRSGVLHSQDKNVSIFQSASLDAKSKLVEFPHGTLAQWSNQEGDAYKITLPVVGWVDKANLLILSQ